MPPSAPPRDALSHTPPAQDSPLLHNLKTLHGELLKLPGLDSLLQRLLDSELAAHFPRLNLTSVSVIDRQRTTDDSAQQAPAAPHRQTRSLSEALLEHYCQQGWPAAQSREFIAPDYHASAAATLTWEAAIGQLANNLGPRLQAELKAFWDQPSDSGQSRRALLGKLLGSRWHAEQAPQASEQQVSTEPLFDQLAQNILAQQAANIAPMLQRYCQGKGQLNLPAAFDLALDIRALIDPRLLAFDTRGRWSTRLDRRPASRHGDDLQRHVLAPDLETFKFQHRQLRAIQAQLLEQLTRRPTLRSFASDALARALREGGWRDLALANLYFGDLDPASRRPPGSRPSWTQPVLEHWLEYLNGRAKALADTARVGLFSLAPDGTWQHLQRPALGSLNALLSQLQPGFLEHFLRRQRTLYGELSALLGEALQSGFQREAQFKHRLGLLLESDLAIVLRVLESLHVDSRRSWRGFIPEAFQISLASGSATAPERLRNCFLITERGGLDPEHSGDALLWTPEAGLEGFASLPLARAELERRLQDPLAALPLLATLAPHARPSWSAVPGTRNVPLLGLSPVPENFLGNRVNALIEHAVEDLAHVASMKLSNENLDQQLLTCLDAHTRIAPLQHAIQAARNGILQQALPDWLKSAEANLQLALAQLFEGHLQDARDSPDLLDEIPGLQDNARSKLLGLLHRDFPQHSLDPDKLQLSLTFADSPQTRQCSLTDFALCHFDLIERSQVFVHSQIRQPLPAALSHERLKALVKEAALGNHYRAILDSYLSHTANGQPERQRHFACHAYWQMLAGAFAQVLHKQLSRVAHGFIKHLLASPDGLARPLLDGQRIDLRPLALLRDAYSPADPVPGYYLIGPGLDEPGPQILFMTHGEPLHFIEYAGEAQLLAQLNATTELQRQLLAQLDPKTRAHYQDRLFSRHQPDVRLLDKPLRGNLFRQLYQDLREVLKEVLGRQQQKGDESLWDRVVQLLTSGLQQGARYLLGRRHLPALIWQTLPHLKDAADKAWHGDWQGAMREFIHSLAHLALARSGEPSPSAAPLAHASLQLPGGAGPAAWPLPEPAWTNLRQGQRTQVLAFEEQALALQDLTEDRPRGLYSDRQTRRDYAVLAGRVFAIAERPGQPGQWRLFKDDTPGPLVQRDSHGQWSLLQRGKLRGGRYAERLLDYYLGQESIKQEMHIEASGMHSIRALYPMRANLIQRAHQQAFAYLDGARTHLQQIFSSSRLDTRRREHLLQVFGVTALSNSILDKLNQAIEALLAELLHVSLAPQTSSRFVVGTAKRPADALQAFTVRGDQTKKIYLLERFFEPGFEIYQPIYPRTFDVLAHNMGTILIHELSHQCLQTLNLVYLDSCRPFLDLLERRTPEQQRRWQSLQFVQTTALSLQTPRFELFKELDDFDDRWHDIVGRPRQRILELTATTSLEAARTIFYGDEERRIDVILANADSLALLLAYLGRPVEYQPLYQSGRTA